MSQILSDTRSDRLPALSMVVPVYNVAPYVKDCLASIRAQGIPLELILIDDGSTDESPQVIRSQLTNWPEVLWLQQDNRGLSAARNLGARLARGTYLGFVDSDDRLWPDSLGKLLNYAQSQRCDLVLGRTNIFDSKTQAVTPFYDHALWDLLLRGQADRLVTAGEVPHILSLEPNANYRLIRRQFWEDEGLHFPEGLLFEDAPVHFQALLSARRIGLLAVPYYGYRVNRAGKITEQSSLLRFDLIEVLRLSIAGLQSGGATASQGGAALRVMFRLSWGCGCMTPPTERLRFFREACALFATLPPTWFAGYQSQCSQDPRHLILGALLTGSESALLADWSLGRRDLLALGRFLLRRGYSRHVLRSGWTRLWHGAALC